MLDLPTKLSLELQNKCLNKNLTIACAESCTGGMLSSFLTKHSGASKYFKLGLITYSNFAKHRFLNIDYELLDRVGAVSEEVAIIMATNCRTAAQTDISASITGIASPDHNNNINDVGLVYIGISCKNITYAKKIHLSGSREDIRIASCVKTIELLIEAVESI